jgi:Holliday junction resolvase
MKTNKNGIPDLLALKHNETPYFIEVKTSTGKVSPLQSYRMEELKKEGFKVDVHYGK